MNERSERRGLCKPTSLCVFPGSTALPHGPGLLWRGSCNCARFPEGNCLPGPLLTPPVPTHGPGIAVLPSVSSARCHRESVHPGLGRALGMGPRAPPHYAIVKTDVPGEAGELATVRTGSLRTVFFPRNPAILCAK